MEGYDVVTVDDQKIGKVVGETGMFLIVEQGALLKSKHPLPRELAHVDDSEQQVRVTVPKEIVADSPEDRRRFRRAGRGRVLRHRPLARAGHRGLRRFGSRRSVALLRRAGRAPGRRARRGGTCADPRRRRAVGSSRLLARAARRPTRGDRRAGTGRPLGGRERKPPRASAWSRSSRLVSWSSQESVTWPMRFAFACSSPGWSFSVAASLPTQRSQRIPVTCRVSV